MNFLVLNAKKEGFLELMVFVLIIAFQAVRNVSERMCRNVCNVMLEWCFITIPVIHLAVPPIVQTVSPPFPSVWLVKTPITFPPLAVVLV